MKRHPVLFSCMLMIVAGSSCFLIVNIFHMIQIKREAAATSLMLPVFSFRTTDNRVFCNEMTDPSADTLLLNYFDPDCEHCQFMTAVLKKNAPAFHHTQILMISPADSISIRHFISHQQLITVPHIRVLQDSRYQFIKLFGTAAVPSFFIYVNRRLVKKVTGETKLQNLFTP